MRLFLSRDSRKPRSRPFVAQVDHELTALSLGGLGGPSGAGGLGVGLATTPSLSQTVDFSGRIVELIIPFKQGGGFDTWGRFNAPFLSRYLPGQPTVAVRNVPGGNRVNGGGDGGRIAAKRRMVRGAGRCGGCAGLSAGGRSWFS